MKAVMNILASVGFVMLTGLVLVTGSATASTPDGETPANETICDGLKADGVTKGLYGLCVAYCEAQDLDVAGDKDPPNSKILGNYRKKMNAGDPDMPCVAAPCPCWEAAEIQAIADSGAALCSSSSSIAIIRNQTIFAQIDTGRPLCRYVDVSTQTQRLNSDFPADEAQSCYDIVINACAGIGQ